MSRETLERLSRGRANQLHKPRGNPQYQPHNIQPGRVQPAVEGYANQPANYGRGGKHNGQLRVIRHLYPEVLSLTVALLRG